MSQSHYTPPQVARQDFPNWLFDPSILPRLLPVALDSKAPAVNPDTGLHLAFTRQDWPKDAADVDQWFRTRWLPRCSKWQDCPRCKDLPDTSPMLLKGCNLGVRAGRLWRGTPSLTIMDVDRPELFPGLPEALQSGRVLTPRGYHIYTWTESPMPPEGRPWGELRQGLNEYVVAPGSVYPWGRYTPVEPFQIPFWSAPPPVPPVPPVPAAPPSERYPAPPVAGLPLPPPRYRVLTHFRERRVLLGSPVNSPQRHNALQGRITRALGLLVDLWGDYEAILGLLREHNAVFTGPDGFTPDPLSGWEIERLSRSYARMERPIKHTAAFLDRQKQKSAKAIIPRVAAKNATYAAIRASAEGGMRKADLAALHGVSLSTVWRALRGA